MVDWQTLGNKVYGGTAEIFEFIQLACPFPLLANIVIYLSFD